MPTVRDWPNPHPCPRDPRSDTANGRTGRGIKLLEAGEAQVGFVTMGVAQQGWRDGGLDRRQAASRDACVVPDV